MRDLAYVQRLEREVVRLQNDLRAAERELAVKRAPDVEERFRVVLGLTPAQTTILEALWRAKGRSVRVWDIADALDTKAEDANALVRVQVCLMRRRIGRAAISATRSLGYRLTDAGLSLCRSALEAA